MSSKEPGWQDIRNLLATLPDKEAMEVIARFNESPYTIEKFVTPQWQPIDRAELMELNGQE